MINKNTYDCAIIQEIAKDADDDNLTRINYDSTNYYGAMDKCIDYYIYLYISESYIFRSLTGDMLYALSICIVLVVIVEGIRRKLKKAHLIEKNRREEEYKKKLREAAQKAERANLAKTEFLQRMSHDIRTPINAIRGMIEIGDHYADDLKKQADCRKKIWEASGFLLELINEVLDMGKLESGEIKLENEKFNLYDILEEIIHVVEKLASERGIKIIVKKYQVKNWHLIGSPFHIKRMLMNILSNAVKYNKENGKIIMDCKEIDSDDNKAIIKFICKDTGIGMSEEFQKHIFESFTQESSGARSSYAGTGLGMPITKSLVDKMNGTITFESKKNVGTTFNIIIPFKIDKDVSANSKRVGIKNKVSLSGVKVLIAEDNELNMEIAEFIVKNVGAEVVKATNGQEVLDIFSKSKIGEIGIILMDIMMPVIDGLEATRQIRLLDREDAKSVPIFAMTANAFAEDRTSAFDAGMNEHFAKPLDSGLLLKTMERYIKNTEQF